MLGHQFPARFAYGRAEIGPQNIIAAEPLFAAPEGFHHPVAANLAGQNGRQGHLRVAQFTGAKVPCFKVNTASTISASKSSASLIGTIRVSGGMTEATLWAKAMEAGCRSGYIMAIFMIRSNSYGTNKGKMFVT